MSGMLPRTPRVPYVCLQANPLPYQDEHRPASRIRRWALKRSSRHAAATFVPSRHVAELVGDLPRREDRPLGVDGTPLRTERRARP